MPQVQAPQFNAIQDDIEPMPDFVVPNPLHPDNAQPGNFGWQEIHGMAPAVAVGAPPPVAAGNPANACTEFNHRYRHTWISYRYAGANCVGYVTDVTPVTKQLFRIDFHNGLYLRSDNIELLEVFPTSKYVNASYNSYKHPIYFGRKADRQYKRGTSNATFRCHSILREHMNDCKGMLKIEQMAAVANPEFKLFLDALSEPMERGDIIYDLFFPTYPSFQEAIEQLKKSEVFGVAFHKYYMISKQYVKNPWLFRKNFPVAEIVGDRMDIKQDLFKQEIIDLFRRNHITHMELV